MPEAHALGLHHPVDRPARGAAAEAAPEVLVGGDFEAGGVVAGVERAARSQVFAYALEFDAGRFDQARHAHLVF